MLGLIVQKSTQQKRYQSQQNSFDCSGARTPVVRCTIGTMYHWASQADNIKEMMDYIPHVSRYIPTYTYRYLYIPSYTCIYLHIHAYTCIYLHIHAHTCSTCEHQNTQNMLLISARAGASCTMQSVGRMTQVWACLDDPGRFYDRGNMEPNTKSLVRGRFWRLLQP